MVIRRFGLVPVFQESPQFETNHVLLVLQCFTQESIELMGRALYGSKGGVGDIPGVPQGEASTETALRRVDRTLLKFLNTQSCEAWLTGSNCIAGWLKNPIASEWNFTMI